MTVGETIVDSARRFLFVRETDGANRGIWVELFLRFTGTDPGLSWCCAFLSYVLNIVYRGKSPVIKTAVCAELLADCRKKNLIVIVPQVGDIVFSVDATGHAHHVAIYTSAARNAGASIFTIAGNTSDDGASSNGDGVYEHAVTSAGKVYARLPNAA